MLRRTAAWSAPDRMLSYAEGVTASTDTVTSTRKRSSSPSTRSFQMVPLVVTWIRLGRADRRHEIPDAVVLLHEKRLPSEELRVHQTGQQWLQVFEEVLVVGIVQDREPGPMAERGGQLRGAHDTPQVAAVRQGERHGPRSIG